MHHKFPIKTISLETGLSVTTIRSIKAKHDISYKDITKNERHSILFLFDKGLSTIKISRELNIDKDVVSDAIKSSGRNLRGRIPDIDKEKIIKLAKTGLSLSEIDEIIGRNKGSSYSYLSRIGRYDLIKPNKTSYTPETAEEILNLLACGWKYKQLEEKYNVSDVTIRNWVKKYKET